MSLRTDRVRLVVMFKKKDSITREEFDRYWLEDHAKLFSSLAIVKSNVLKYEQAHANQAVSTMLEGFGLPVAPWHGMAIFEAESYEKIMAIFQDEEYMRVVIPERLLTTCIRVFQFMDREGGQMFPADLATFVDK